MILLACYPPVDLYPHNPHNFSKTLQTLVIDFPINNGYYNAFSTNCQVLIFQTIKTKCRSAIEIGQRGRKKKKDGALSVKVELPHPTQPRGGRIF